VIGEHVLSKETHDDSEGNLIGEMPSRQISQALKTEVNVRVATTLDNAVRVEQDAVTGF
jgi:hypothetical protein